MRDNKLLGGLELNRIYQRDCIEGMRMIPDKSIDLIIADPPYYKIKGDFDFVWRTMEEYLTWCSTWIKECERVLKPNGSMYLYGCDLQLEHLAVMVDKNTELTYQNRVTLNKRSYIKDKYGHMEHFRRFIPVAEYVLFYTLKEDFKEVQDYFRKERLDLGWNYKNCDDFMGIKASYCYWDKDTTHEYVIPEEKHYLKLQETGGFKLSYETVKKKYEESRYTFNAKDGMTNVWEFEPDRGKEKTKHPTQKPLSICERLINISSNPGDTVLIPFAGSGSECVAATKLLRNWISFELEPKYIEMANIRIDAIDDLIE
jgi:site-specific DNA-methyltransferase (adenine-specific)